MQDMMPRFAPAGANSSGGVKCTRARPRTWREGDISGAFHGTFGEHLQKGALGGVLINSPGLIAGLLSRKWGLLDAERDPLFPARSPGSQNTPLPAIFWTLMCYTIPGNWTPGLFLDADVLYTTPPPLVCIIYRRCNVFISL